MGDAVWKGADGERQVKVTEWKGATDDGKNIFTVEVDGESKDVVEDELIYPDEPKAEEASTDGGPTIPPEKSKDENIAAGEVSVEQPPTTTEGPKHDDGEAVEDVKKVELLGIVNKINLAKSALLKGKKEDEILDPVTGKPLQGKADEILDYLDSLLGDTYKELAEKFPDAF